MTISFSGAVSASAPCVYDKTDTTKNPTGACSTGIGLKGTDQMDIGAANTIFIGTPAAVTPMVRYDTNGVAE